MTFLKFWPERFDLKLLVFDVEGTLYQTKVRLPGTSIDSTIWQGIAEALGPEAMAAEVHTHEKWHCGSYPSYLDWMKDTIQIHKNFGLTGNKFSNLILSAEYNIGVPETIRKIDRSQFEIVLISGGFRELAARAQIDFDIHHAFAACEYMFDKAGVLRGYNLLPCDFHGKIDFIQLMLREYGLGADDWIFVGDGANDVPIARIAPLSVAYAAHRDLRAVAKYKIQAFTELSRILHEFVQ
jgi:phosphoserine phosphatase